MWNAVEETNMEAILAVMNTTWIVVKIRPEKFQACTGFEPEIDWVRQPKDLGCCHDYTHLQHLVTN